MWGLYFLDVAPLFLKCDAFILRCGAVICEMRGLYNLRWGDVIFEMLGLFSNLTSSHQCVLSVFQMFRVRNFRIPENKKQALFGKKLQNSHIQERQWFFMHDIEYQTSQKRSTEQSRNSSQAELKSETSKTKPKFENHENLGKHKNYDKSKKHFFNFPHIPHIRAHVMIFVKFLRPYSARAQYHNNCNALIFATR